MSFFKRVFLLSALFLPVLLQPAVAQVSEITKADWGQWRGPARDGSFEGAPFPEQLNDSTLQATWRKELGPGYSGPIVAGDLVFVTETRDEKYEVAQALNRETGQQVWETRWQGAMQVPFFAAENGSWIRSTPVYDNGRLYVGGMVDVLVCLNAKDGRQIWKVDFPAATGSKKPDFGFASSPLVLEDGVYVQAGGAFYKLNKETGETIWKTLGDGGGMFGSAFSSPVRATIGGVDQLVVQTRQSLNGIDAKDGRVLWSQNVPSFRGMNILTPLVVGDSVFTSSYRNASFLYDLKNNSGSWSVTTRWQVNKPAYMSTPVARDGFVYMHLGNQRFTCIDLKNGETRWTSEPFGKYSSLIIQDDRILALDQRGELLMFRAAPERFELLGQHRVSNQETWAHLAASGDELFIRELNAIAAFRFK